MTIELQYAVSLWLNRGMYVFSLPHGQKSPPPKEWPDKATNDPRVAKEMFGDGPANIAVVPGKSGHAVIDVDGKQGVRELRRILDGEKLPPTLSWTTGRGRHMLYKLPEGTLLKSHRLAPQLDIKCDRGYVLVPPALHPSGKHYEYVDANQPIVELPRSVYDKLVAEGAKRLQDAAVEQTDLVAPGGVPQVREMVRSIPNDEQWDRDRYIQMGAAIKAALPSDPGEAFEIWQEWCDRWTEGTNESDVVERDWKGLRPPFALGWHWIENQARDYMKSDPVDVFEFEEPPEPEEIAKGLEERIRKFLRVYETLSPFTRGFRYEQFVERLAKDLGISPRAAGRRLDEFAQAIQQEGRGSMSARNVAAMMAQDPPTPPEEVLPRLAWRGRMTFFFGPEKQGKSTTCRVMATEALVAGHKVLWVDYEEGATQFRMAVNETPGLAEVAGGMYYVEKPTVEMLESMVSEIDPDVVVIDSIFSAATVISPDVPGNDQPWLWMQLILSLKGLAEVGGGERGVVLLGHTVRDGSRYLGSTGIGAGPDMLVHLKKVRGGARRLEYTGRDMGIPFRSVDLIRTSEGGLRVLSAEERINEDHETIKEIVRDSPGINASEICEEAELKGLSGKKKIRGMINWLEEQGEIENRGTSYNHREYYIPMPFDFEDPPGGDDVNLDDALEES